MAGLRLAHEPVGVGAVSPQLDGRALRRHAGRDGLEVPVAVAAPLARRPIGRDDDVTELGPAAVEPSVDHHAAADAGSERERDEVVRAPARADPPLRERDRIAVVLDPDRQREPLAEMCREVERAQREIDGAEADPRAPIDVHRDPDPDRGGAVGEQILDEPVELFEERRLARRSTSDLDRPPDRAVSRDHAGEHLRPADVHPDDQVRRHDAATIPGRMPAQDKPYRVYRGGRAKGRVPLTRHTSSPAPRRTRRGRRRSPRTPRKPRRPGRWIALGLVLLLVLLVAWAVGSYLSVASGVSEANDRVPAGVKRQLDEA